MQAQLCSRLIAKFLISNCGVATNSFLIVATRLRTHRSNRTPVVAAAADAPAHAARTEAQVVGEVAARVERTRPVVAATACIAEIVVAANARHRKKDRITATACF